MSRACSIQDGSEDTRLNALYELNLLDTAPSESFDRITRMASQLFNLPIAAVSLTDRDRQWFKSRVGVDYWQIPREKAPCRRVAESADLLVIPDFDKDEYYKDSLLAHSGIRFYAGAPLMTRDGHALGAMCVLGTEPRTVTEQEMAALKDLAAIVMAQIELQHAFGRIDPVSGLSNRNQFVEDVEDLARDYPGEPRLAVAVDLIDPTQHTAALHAIGPAFTDDLIRTASQRLRRLVSQTTPVYQIGPTHLGYLLPSLNDGDLVAEATRIREELATVSGAQSTPLAIRAALGVAPFRLGEATPQDMLRAAHSAAQDARNAGEALSVYSASRDEAHRRRFQLLSDFPDALAAPDQLSLVFQPRMDQRSGRCIGAEALLRWRHPTLGHVSPGEFIPIIEQTALSRDMTEWVVTAALGQLATWRTEGSDLTLSVNISAANLDEDDFSSRLIAMARQSNVPPQAFELELTESEIIRKGHSALEQMNALRVAGFRIAIDDFGTGYSSLSYLEKIPANVVKIDRSFVQDLGSPGRSVTVVGATISLIRSLGFRVVAEGVETQQAYDTLLRLGCDEAQGYLIARPLPSQEFQGWLQHARCSKRLVA
ncbi:sensor domain-containing phosphodiesterase [Microvirga sp. HBU67558]|nr:sensor domain-containing phosphodiesterase [Microvirga sp. HBU67558]